ncbi:4-hydroxy-tetrahydrodipicolinate reductase, partial [Candidatus Saccharibacteria bacterium]|nr:4-hydroxy-tetrahydrodipicolinate reductase [Candidatus Saccharibacteria bacterium]NIV04594.1 4-hydroxy-tetrahydrodipicolinate reductase [Calditrichia bacterium]NIV73208.1 4-hydroxy-tetrahydrodipicolinate reductase [Calditrichia bacterium]NIW00573.1 4-hydroxy-tetrahydrodipicolinate reductase [Candidatus Saccharibacteria bacterium]NIW80931.1 4-hydroxy-tetrahydrodipicolinate reductase [Calditrichia bacterium]
LAKTLELPEEEVIQYGRKGTDLSRGKEVAIHSLRGGSVIGEHQVNFLSSNENIKITHQAQSRKIFSDGVLQAVQWIATQPAGYYTMQDVLNLRI